jgi:hypothetical protein
MFGLTMRTDENSWCTSFDLSLTSLDAYMACSPGSELTINFAGVIWLFYIDTRNRSMSFNNVNYKVSGRSISAKMNITPLHKTWPQITAKEAAEELAGTYGLLVNWQSINWVIPSGVLSADGETAIEVIVRLANACGSLVQTEPDGTIKVYPAYNWTATPEIVYGVDFDIFELDENSQVLPFYNQVQISDKDYVVDDDIVLEVESQDFTTNKTIIRAWIYPWNLTLSVVPTATGVVSTYLGWYEEQETELVEFTAGKGAVSRPIISIDSINWGDHPDLGSLTFSDSSIFSANKEWSLAQITYTRKYHKYEIHRITHIDEPAQVTAFV